MSRGAGMVEAEAALDARLLAERVLGWDAATLLTRASEPEPPAFAARYEALVARRVAREPMAYILGRREFWGLDFDVSPAVLIPRPDTELIVEAALAAFPDRDAPLDISDVGTGSGCLAVALGRERPNARLVATDISTAALDVARRNAARHGVADRVTFIEADLLRGIDRSFDLIVSNPPYVREVDRGALQPEVLHHEPATALFGGADGLAIIRRLVDDAAPRLTPKGFLIFEFGCGQDDAVTELVARAPGLAVLDVRTDLQGIPRVAVARKS